MDGGLLDGWEEGGVVRRTGYGDDAEDCEGADGRCGGVGGEAWGEEVGRGELGESQGRVVAGGGSVVGRCEVQPG